MILKRVVMRNKCIANMSSIFYFFFFTQTTVLWLLVRVVMKDGSVWLWLYRWNGVFPVKEKSVRSSSGDSIVSYSNSIMQNYTSWMSKKDLSIYTLVVLCTCYLCVCQGFHLEKLFPERGFCAAVIRDLCPVEHSVAPSLWQFDQ